MHLNKILKKKDLVALFKPSGAGSTEGNYVFKGSLIKHL